MPSVAASDTSADMKSTFVPRAPVAQKCLCTPYTCRQTYVQTHLGRCTCADSGHRRRARRRRRRRQSRARRLRACRRRAARRPCRAGSQSPTTCRRRTGAAGGGGPPGGGPRAPFGGFFFTPPPPPPPPGAGGAPPPAGGRRGLRAADAARRGRGAIGEAGGRRARVHLNEDGVGRLYPARGRRGARGSVRRVRRYLQR